MKTETEDTPETHYPKKIDTTLVIAMANGLDGKQHELDEAPDELLLNLVFVMNGYLQQYDCEIRDVKGENGKYYDTATDLLEDYPDHRGTYTDTVTGAEDFLVSVEEHETCTGREVEELPEL